MTDSLKKLQPFTRLWFLLNADELYTLTRFSYFAFLQNVAFRNAHHALEYYYKAGLADSVPLEKLKQIGHSLRKLHRKFIEVVSPLSVTQEEIDYLDHFDDLRYPKDYGFTHTGWGLPLTEFFDRFPPETRYRLACLSITDIDRIVHCIRNSIAPHGLDIMVVTGEHGEFLYRENQFFSPKPIRRQQDSVEQPTRHSSGPRKGGG